MFQEFNFSFVKKILFEIRDVQNACIFLLCLGITNNNKKKLCLLSRSHLMYFCLIYHICFISDEYCMKHFHFFLPYSSLLQYVKNLKLFKIIVNFKSIKFRHSRKKKNISFLLFALGFSAYKIYYYVET